MHLCLCLSIYLYIFNTLCCTLNFLGKARSVNEKKKHNCYKTASFFHGLWIQIKNFAQPLAIVLYQSVQSLVVVPRLLLIKITRLCQEAATDSSWHDLESGLMPSAALMAYWEKIKAKYVEGKILRSLGKSGTFEKCMKELFKVFF